MRSVFFLLLFLLPVWGAHADTPAGMSTGTPGATPESSMAPASAALTAVAEMNPTQGNTVQGEIKFIQKKDYLLVLARIQGLTPGSHPFHVHETGDCSSTDGSSAGGHFKFSQPPTSGPAATVKDVADLGKLTADAHGIVKAKFKNKILQLSGPNSIVGRSVVIHASDSPARVACGIIQTLQ
jgi:Cu-Zn family superoxide dismutase